MFTDRFLKVPIDLFDHELASSIGDIDAAKTVEVFARINPLEICYYREVFVKGEPENETLVYLKNGENFNVKYHIEKFENILNKHQSS